MLADSHLKSCWDCDWYEECIADKPTFYILNGNPTDERKKLLDLKLFFNSLFCCFIALLNAE
jgi:hypothetical protein